MQDTVCALIIMTLNSANVKGTADLRRESGVHVRTESCWLSDTALKHFQQVRAEEKKKKQA